MQAQGYLPCPRKPWDEPHFPPVITNQCQQKWLHVLSTPEMLGKGQETF